MDHRDQVPDLVVFPVFVQLDADRHRQVFCVQLITNGFAGQDQFVVDELDLAQVQCFTVDKTN
ncbi:hypothetical protein D3C75_1309240 [compost metagenome]